MTRAELSGVRWRKSSHSTDTGGDCVEVASIAPEVAFRDSKDADGPSLVFAAAELGVFLRRVKTGELDLG
ncbi:DUF397 domain-containing protein [Spirillospora sp. CA-294931]|uniref:DUF397 domain-containing protein n=1 Tax=Spirillospora sp. CA-294931 TaxID=3240042 RepID=UPI003D8F8145